MTDPFRVLAIDGGGIRGVIPATVLVELEQRLAAGIQIVVEELTAARRSRIPLSPMTSAERVRWWTTRPPTMSVLQQP